jgi:hypothetical protein
LPHVFYETGSNYGYPMLVDTGRFVEDLTLIALATESGEWAGRKCYLPLYARTGASWTLQIGPVPLSENRANQH